MGGVVSQISGRSLVSTRMGTGPTFSSSTNCFVPAGTVPSSSSTKLVPTVGCPAKGSSRVGVKMRTPAASEARVAGTTKTVSERFISRAIFCIVTSSRPEASGNTARGFPSRGWVVNTSTTR